MPSSTASRGSKRPAVEDETLRSGHDTGVSKRVKPARNTSTNQGELISKYFNRNKPKPKTMHSSHQSDDQSSTPHPVPVTASKDSQRKDRSLSPPASSRHEPSSKSANNHQNFDSYTPEISESRNIIDERSSALMITEHIGDIFDAPTNALLIHACNCKGYWGKGIAKAFKQKYPEAFKIYKAHCNKPDKRLLGKALLIPPQPRDGNQHFIGCVFTSANSGVNVAPPHKIIEATGPAMTDLLAQARSYLSRGRRNISELRMCKINSGLFKVEWEDTREELETSVESHGFRSVDVFSMSHD